MAGNQDALQLSGATSVYVVSKEGGGGGDRSADVSHAAGPLLTHNTHYEGLMGVTTPQRGKQRDDYEGQSKDKYALFGAERAIRQQLELLDQDDLHAAAAHAEAIGGARAEAERIIVGARAEAERVIVAANRTRAESDRAVARERLRLQHKLAELNNQPYPVRTPTGESNLSKHGEIDVPPWRNGRPDRVATEE